MSELDDKLEQVFAECVGYMQLEEPMRTATLRFSRALTAEVHRLTVEACAQIADREALDWKIRSSGSVASEMIAKKIRALALPTRDATETERLREEGSA